MTIQPERRWCADHTEEQREEERNDDRLRGADSGDDYDKSRHVNGGPPNGLVCCRLRIQRVSNAEPNSRRVEASNTQNCAYHPTYDRIS